MALIEKHLHIHIHAPGADGLANLLQEQAKNLQTIMATLLEFQAALKRITDATTNISADLVRLAEKIEQGGISAADEDAFAEQLRAAATKLEEAAAVNPEPPVEEEPA